MYFRGNFPAARGEMGVAVSPRGAVYLAGTRQCKFRPGSWGAHAEFFRIAQLGSQEHLGQPHQPAQPAMLTSHFPDPLPNSPRPGRQAGTPPPLALLCGPTTTKAGTLSNNPAILRVSAFFSSGQSTLQLARAGIWPLSSLTELVPGLTGFGHVAGFRASGAEH